MKMRVVARIVSVASVFTVLGAVVPAASAQSNSSAQLRTARQWQERLAQAAQALKAGQWKRAADGSDSLLREMRDMIVSGNGAGPTIALALLYRALGEAGAGDLDLAGWDFGAAQAILPDFATADLSEFGAVGKQLESWRRQDGHSIAALDGHGLGIVPPRRLNGRPPAYPKAKSVNCAEGTVELITIVNDRGRLAQPAFPKTIDPVLALAVLEGVKEWRFEPAQLDGRRIAVVYNIVVNFHLRGCS